MMKLIASTVAALALLPTIVSAQRPAVHAESDSQIRTGAIAVDLTPRTVPADAATRTPAARQKADRLWNGVLVGAGLGAVGGAVTGRVIVQCSECAGFNVPLTFGVLGAGIGGVLGALIDAAHVRPQRAPARHVRLSPTISKGKFAVAGTITFGRIASHVP